MTVEHTEQSVSSTGPATATADSAMPPAAAQQSVRTQSSRITTSGPSRPELGRRIVVLLFGLIQVVIGARFVLLLLDAREANGLVAGIINFSQLFVAPFEGILRTDALHAAGSVFDVTAIVALAGWTVLELIVIWAIGIFRREPA